MIYDTKTSLQKKLAIGYRIRDLREANSISQLDYSEMLGLQPQSVSKWERGLTMPPVEDLQVIAETLGVDAEDLFDTSPALISKSTRRTMDEVQAFVEIDAPYAKSVAQKALQKSPDDVYLLCCLMRSCAELGELDETIKLGKRILSLPHDDNIMAHIHYSTGIAYAKNEQYFNARTEFVKLPPITMTQKLLIANYVDNETGHIAAKEELVLQAETALKMLIKTIAFHKKKGNEKKLNLYRDELSKYFNIVGKYKTASGKSIYELYAHKVRELLSDDEEGKQSPTHSKKYNNKTIYEEDTDQGLQ